MFDEKGPKLFLQFCKWLVDMRLVGLQVCWAFEFCQENVQDLFRLVELDDRKLIDFVNEKADLYECFTGNPKLSRAFPRGEGNDSERRPEPEKLVEQQGLRRRANVESQLQNNEEGVVVWPKDPPLLTPVSPSSGSEESEAEEKAWHDSEKTRSMPVVDDRKSWQGMWSVAKYWLLPRVVVCVVVALIFGLVTSALWLVRNWWT